MEFHLDAIAEGGAHIGLLLGVILVASALLTGMNELLVLGAGMGLYSGLRLMNARPRARPLQPLAAFRSLVEAQPLPFWVCTRCRVMHTHDTKGCTHCEGRVDFLDVTCEADRHTALVAIGEE